MGCWRLRGTRSLSEEHVAPSLPLLPHPGSSCVTSQGPLVSFLLLCVSCFFELSLSLRRGGRRRPPLLKLRSCCMRRRSWPPLHRIRATWSRAQSLQPSPLADLLDEPRKVERVPRLQRTVSRPQQGHGPWPLFSTCLCLLRGCVGGGPPLGAVQMLRLPSRPTGSACSLDRVGCEASGPSLFRPKRASRTSIVDGPPPRDSRARFGPPSQSPQKTLSVSTSP